MKHTMLMACAATMLATPCMAATAKSSASGPATMMANYYIMKADTNGDGMVSKDEAAAYGQKCFDMADTNHDGMLSKKEITAAKAKEHREMLGMSSQLKKTGMAKSSGDAAVTSATTTTTTSTDTATDSAATTDGAMAPTTAGDTNGATGMKGSNPDIPPKSDVQLGSGSTGTSQGKSENGTATSP